MARRTASPLSRPLSGVPLAEALNVLLEERANQNALRDALNVTAAALLGFGSVIVQLILTSKHYDGWQHDATLALLLLGLTCMLLCLLDWRFVIVSRPAWLTNLVGVGTRSYERFRKMKLSCWVYQNWPLRRHNPDTISPDALRRWVTGATQSEADLFNTLAELIDADKESVIYPKRRKLGIGILFFAAAGFVASTKAWL